MLFASNQLLAHILLICKEVEPLNVLVAVQVPPPEPQGKPQPPFNSNLCLPAIAVMVAAVLTPLLQKTEKLAEYSTLLHLLDTQ